MWEINYRIWYLPDDPCGQVWQLYVTYPLGGYSHEYYYTPQRLMQRLDEYARTYHPAVRKVA